MPSTRIIFCGTPNFAIPALKALIAEPGLEVVSVITQPDKLIGRSQTLTPPPVKELAEKTGIPVLQPPDINTILEDIEALKPDFLVVVAYGQLIKEPILSLPGCTPINIHYSLLPRWRGAAPVQHALLAGEEKSGVTVQQIVLKLDAGPILAQEELIIEPRDTTSTLLDRLNAVGAQILVNTLKRPLQPKEQDESKATFCTKLTREDGECNPEKETAEEIDRRVRAFVPWPGVRCMIRGQEIKLIETALEPLAGSMPLECKDGTTLHIVKLQPPSKREMSGEEWLRGQR